MRLVVAFISEDNSFFSLHSLIIAILYLFYRLMVVAGQPSLSDQFRGLVWEWLIHWPWSSSAIEDGLSDGDTLSHSQEYEGELKEMTLKTSVFDSNGEQGGGGGGTLAAGDTCSWTCIIITLALHFHTTQKYSCTSARQGAYPSFKWTALQVRY